MTTIEKITEFINKIYSTPDVKWTVTESEEGYLVVDNGDNVITLALIDKNYSGMSSRFLTKDKQTRRKLGAISSRILNDATVIVTYYKYLKRKYNNKSIENKSNMAKKKYDWFQKSLIWIQKQEDSYKSFRLKDVEFKNYPDSCVVITGTEEISGYKYEFYISDTLAFLLQNGVPICLNEISVAAVIDCDF